MRVEKHNNVNCTLSKDIAVEFPYRRKNDIRRLRVEIAIRAIASELTIA